MVTTQPVATVTTSSPRVLTGNNGDLWAALADQLLLEIRHALHGTPGRIRVAVPALSDLPLYGWATRRFDFTLGERDRDAVTLPVLLERYLELGGRVDVLVRQEQRTGAASSASSRQLARLLGRFPAARLLVRECSVLDAFLVVAPSFACISSAGAVERVGGAGDAGMLGFADIIRSEVNQAIETLWRVARPVDLEAGRAG